MSRGPALLVCEFSSIARGVVVADAALKHSPALLLHSRTVSSGRHLLVFEGNVADVGEARVAVEHEEASTLLGLAHLPAADDQVWPLLGGRATPTAWHSDAWAEAVAIVETLGIPGAIRAADAACKVAPVRIEDAALSIDLGGKAYFVIVGQLPDVQVAAATAHEAAATAVHRVEVIAQPELRLRGQLFR